MLSAFRQSFHALRHHAVSDCSHQQSGSPLIQFVRWKKRRWAPLNRSKEFYVRKPTPIDPEEWAELKRRTDIYKTHLRAITKYFKTKMEAGEKAAVSTSVFEQQEREFQSLLVENDRWNQETAKIREARQAAEDAAAEEKRLKKLIDYERARELQQQAAEQMVQEQMEQAKHFIDMENLDAEIERALNMRVNYNFAIDLEGNRYIEMPDGSTSVEKDCESMQIFDIPEQSKDSSEAAAGV